MSTGEPMELWKPTQLDQARGISNARSESMSLRTMMNCMTGDLRMVGSETIVNLRQAEAP